jgi:hypothetical protein
MISVEVSETREDLDASKNSVRGGTNSREELMTHYFHFAAAQGLEGNV